MFPMRNRERAFILLEVMLALLILAVAMTAILRGFIMSLGTIRENTIMMKSSLLVETLLDDYELEPPVDGRADGSFADDKRFGPEWKSYFWERDVEEEDVDYDGFASDPLQEREPILFMTLRIVYDDGQYRRFVPIEVETALLPSEVFTRESLQSSQLF